MTTSPAWLWYYMTLLDCDLIFDLVIPHKFELSWLRLFNWIDIDINLTWMSVLGYPHRVFFVPLLMELRDSGPDGFWFWLRQQSSHYSPVNNYNLKELQPNYSKSRAGFGSWHYHSSFRYVDRMLKCEQTWKIIHTLVKWLRSDWPQVQLDVHFRAFVNPSTSVFIFDRGDPLNT